MLRIGLLTRKIGCSTLFNEVSFTHQAVTILHLENSCVLSVRKSPLGSFALVGYGDAVVRRVNKPQRVWFSKLNTGCKRKLLEFKISDESISDDQILKRISVNHFNIGQFVDAIGTSIGKGFAGVMKRYNFRGLRSSHGVSLSHRSHGSTGQCQDPGRVFKGKKMAGRMGGKRVTIQNLRIVDMDFGKQLLVVHGAVPGAKNSYVLLKDAVKKSLVNNSTV